MVVKFAQSKLEHLIEVKNEFDQEWMWNGWIPHGEMSMLVGHQGSGKSAFALYMCRQLSLFTIL